MENRKARDFLGWMDFTAELPDPQNHESTKTGYNTSSLQNSHIK